MIKPQTLKGFRDFLPAEALKREYILQKIEKIFISYGFDPLETPALEYAETLMGKYGTEADKLLYLFEDNGGRKIGLRYDQTVPFSRVIAQYSQELPTPFKRYQIQPVWRAENTQRGRYREFLQCDIDTVGSTSVYSDVEIIACTLDALKNIGFKKPQICLNDRSLFDSLGLTKKEIIIIDKLDKIGKDAVLKELADAGRAQPAALFDSLTGAAKTERLTNICLALTQSGYVEGEDFLFSPFLARGLDYYTSTIFEAKIGDLSEVLSVAGGGRYDKLIGSFSGTDVPAVGIAFGFDRIVELADQLSLLPNAKTRSQLLICILGPENAASAVNLAGKIRTAGLNTEIYPDQTAKLDKQLKYADKKGIPFVAIIGTNEVKDNTLTLKNMTSGVQSIFKQEALEKLTAHVQSPPLL